MSLCSSVNPGALTFVMYCFPAVGLKKTLGCQLFSAQESRLVLERILNEWLVYENFLQLSVLGQMENMMSGCEAAVTVSRRPNEIGSAKVNGIPNREHILTLSDVLPCPLVILEERMPLDLIYTIAAKSDFPVGFREDMLSLIQDHFSSLVPDFHYTSRSSS